jgi:two-component system, chemotaxis family, protein-glutamate methylesterase/glutaminase
VSGNAGPRPIRVLVVDDSALMRRVLSDLIGRDPGIVVVGTAPDARIAADKIRTLEPDVLTLDVEMPGMDGLAFLETIMRSRPLPVIMVSSLTSRGSDVTLRALELGAIDFVLKPHIDLTTNVPGVVPEIVEKIKAAAVARPRLLHRPVTNGQHAPAPPVARPTFTGSRPRIIAVGASTGGTEAIREVLAGLPANAPGIVIVQHMPERFTKAFAERLDRLCAVRVKEAQNGDRVLQGHVLIAPGNFHMRVRRDGWSYDVAVDQAAPVNRHRPSVDVLFESVAAAAGRNAVGVLMTGMGADGAQGLLAMKRGGAHTIAQDEATSIVFGMPKEAILLGAADHVVPLAEISKTSMELAVS